MATAETIRFRCSCGAVLSVPASMAGRTGKCFKCGNPVVAPIGGSPGDASSAAPPLEAAAPSPDREVAAAVAAGTAPRPARVAAARARAARQPADGAPGEKPSEEAPVFSGPAMAGFPSWGISTGFHALLLLLLSIIVVASAEQQQQQEVFAVLDESKPPPVDFTPPEVKPEQIVDVKAPILPTYAPTFTPQTLDRPTDKPVVQVATFEARSDDSAPKGMESPNPVVTMMSSDGGDVDVIGVGGGGGSGSTGEGGTNKFGWRTDGGGKQTALRLHGGSPASEAAVDKALQWLAGHQSHDTNGGFWDCGKHGGRHITHPEVKPEDRMSYDVAVTGLAVLAFLGAGHTTTDPKYGKVVTDALYWLEAHQDPKTGRWPGSHYGQGIASLSVAEAFGMGCGHQEMAQKALNYVRSAQNPEGGWNYYTTNRDRNDTSITGWQVMAAKSARIAGLEIPDALFEDARKHFKNVMGTSGETAGGGDWKIVYAREKNLIHTNEAAGPDAIGAITVLSLLYMGMSPQDPVVLKAAEYFKNRKPNILNLYYTYYGTLAMFQVGGEYWQAWNKEMHDPLIQAQVKGRGEDDGSWDYQNDAWGPGGGRVYTTAMAAMTLEVYYRYLPILNK